MTAKGLVAKMIQLHIEHPDFTEDHPRAVGRRELLIDAIELVYGKSYWEATAYLERKIMQHKGV